MTKKRMFYLAAVLLSLVFLADAAWAQTLSLNMQDQPTGSATARIFNVILMITILSLVVYPHCGGIFNYAQRLGNAGNATEYGVDFAGAVSDHVCDGAGFRKVLGRGH